MNDKRIYYVVQNVSDRTYVAFNGESLVSVDSIEKAYNFESKEEAVHYMKNACNGDYNVYEVEETRNVRCVESKKCS